MLIKKSQIPIFVFTLIYLLAALFIFLGRKNYEFVAYVGVVAFFFVLIIATNKKVNYPNSVLWLMSVWGLLHMLGGGVLLKKEGGTMVLYKLILIPLSETYPIFRYDQFVHIFGFGAATLIMYVILKPRLKPLNNNWAAVSIVVVMAGLGVGALNEIIEFTATVLAPSTGVGGYVNNSLDLVSDLIGSVLAMIYIRLRKGNI